MRGTNPSGIEDEKRHQPVHCSSMRDEREGESGVPRTDVGLLALARLLAEIAVGAEARTREAAVAEESTKSVGEPRRVPLSPVAQ